MSVKPEVSEADLSAIETRLNQTTAGPWEVIADAAVTSVWLNAARPEDDMPIALFDYRSAAEVRANAQFVAAMREDVPRLIAEIRRLNRRVDDLLAANNLKVAECNQLRRELEDYRNGQAKSQAEQSGG